MAWIESHQEMGRHPKTIRVAHRLGISKAQAIGHLHLLWWWTLDFAPEGDLSVFSASELATAAEWSGGAEEFVAVLRECGWIDGDLKVHDWRDYAGKYVEERAQARERMRRFRERQRADREARRERRNPQGVLDLPVEGEEAWREGLREHREFCSAWRDWRRHLAEAGRPMSGVQEEEVLRECGRQGAERSVEVVRFSIRKGARNLIWDDAPRRKPREVPAAIEEPIDPGEWRAYLAAEYVAADLELAPGDAPEVVRRDFHQWKRRQPVEAAA